MNESINSLVYAVGAVAVVALIAELIAVRRLLRLQERLRHHDKEHRAILDALPAMVWYKDKNNVLLRANRAAGESIGLRSEELEGRSTYELYPDEAAKYHQDDLEVINSGKPKLGIIELITTSSGEKRWVQTGKLPCRDNRGQVTGVI